MIRAAAVVLLLALAAAPDDSGQQAKHDRGNRVTTRQMKTSQMKTSHVDLPLEIERPSISDMTTDGQKTDEIESLG